MFYLTLLTVCWHRNWLIWPLIILLLPCVCLLMSVWGCSWSDRNVLEFFVIAVRALDDYYTRQLVQILMYVPCVLLTCIVRLLDKYNKDSNKIYNPYLLKYLLNPSAWSDGHFPHAARSHSFVYISTSWGANVIGLLRACSWRSWLSYSVGESS